jgi:hypothetical protein
MDDTHPNVVASIYQLERQTSLFIGQANPHLTIHHEAMVQVYNRLLQTIWSLVNLSVILPLPPGEPMQTQQVSIASLHHMLFRIESIQRTYIDKIRGISNAT